MFRPIPRLPRTWRPYTELKKFLESYPAFPLKNSILHELELNKLVLYPFEKDDLFGFTDEQGDIHIKAEYEAASEFREGLSLVVKGDSVYFINKENQNPFGKIFEEASVFNNGIAPVKQKGKWVFINRQGQVISKEYDEISELSDDSYVVKLNGKYGALDNYGQVILEPRFIKLGDFKNGYAYYTDGNLYGFSSKNGPVISAQYEWISDFDADGLASVRQNGKYGLISASGRLQMEPSYDLVLKTNYPIYLLVADNQYGFYSSRNRCFVAAVTYDYAREKPVTYYTDGQTFKLLKKKQQALIDQNGHQLIPYGQYDEVNFVSGGMMLVKKRGKYGYLDSKMQQRIPFKYSEADDFAGGTAIVSLKDKYYLINSEGKEVYSTTAEIERLTQSFFMLDDDQKTIINSAGDTVASGVAGVQKLKDSTLIVTLNSGDLLLFEP